MNIDTPKGRSHRWEGSRTELLCLYSWPPLLAQSPGTSPALKESMNFSVAFSGPWAVVNKGNDYRRRFASSSSETLGKVVLCLSGPLWSWDQSESWGENRRNTWEELKAGSGRVSPSMCPPQWSRLATLVALDVHMGDPVILYPCYSWNREAPENLLQWCLAKPLEPKEPRTPPVELSDTCKNIDTTVKPLTLIWRAPPCSRVQSKGGPSCSTQDSLELPLRNSHSVDWSLYKVSWKDQTIAF